MPLNWGSSTASPTAQVGRQDLLGCAPYARGGELDEQAGELLLEVDEVTGGGWHGGKSALFLALSLPLTLPSQATVKIFHRYQRMCR